MIMNQFIKRFQCFSCFVFFFYLIIIMVGLGGSVGCAFQLETRRSWVQPPTRSATFFRGDWSWNIFSTVILSLPLIQEGQLSVSGKRMCTILVNRLEDYACPVNVWLGKLTSLDMTPLGWLGRKTSTQTWLLSFLKNKKRLSLSVIIIGDW